MAYQIYQDLKGPVIPASIFSSAAERGGKMGKLLDTPETARLKGEQLGRERAMVEETHEENIESANINQESAKIAQETARVQQDRQREALEADKRANKLAPIKEALNIAGGVVDVIGGVQGLMENSNQLTVQEQQIEINNNKLDIERATHSITKDTELLSTENAKVVAEREAADLDYTTKIAKAMANDDSASVLDLFNSEEGQSHAMRNPDEGLRITGYLHQKGDMPAAEKQEKEALYGGQKIFERGLVLKQQRAQARQKAVDNLGKNFKALGDVVDPLLSRHAAETDKDPEYYEEEDRKSKLRLVPKHMYELNKDGKSLNLQSNPERKVEADEGIYFINGSGEIIEEFDKEAAKPYQKVLDSYFHSKGALDWMQQQDAARYNLDIKKDGTTQRKVDKPAPNKPLPDRGLAAEKQKRLGTSKQRLSDLGVDYKKVEMEGQAAGTKYKSDPWYSPDRIVEGAKSVLNKIAPSLVDNVSNYSLRDAEKAAKESAKETMALYNKSTPKEKKALVSKIAQMSDGAGFSRSHYYADAEGRTLEGNFFKGENREGGKLAPLEAMYKAEIINEMEQVREGGKRDALSGRTVESVERRQTQDAANADLTPEGAARSSQIAAEIKAKESGQQAEGPLQNVSHAPKQTGGGASEREIDQVVTYAQNAKGWSDGKRNSVEAKVNRVETNTFLQNESPEVKAVAAVESNVTMDDVSWDRSNNIVGLMQVGKAAEADVRKLTGNYELDRSIPEDNVEIGKTYLQYLSSIDQFRDDKRLIYAAYNGGMGTIKDAIKLAGGDNSWKAVTENLFPVLEAQYEAAVMRQGKDSVSWTPFGKFIEITNYPLKVLEYEEIFSNLGTQQEARRIFV